MSACVKSTIPEYLDEGPRPAIFNYGIGGLQSGEGRMMIDSVVWAQHINVQPRHQTEIVNEAHLGPV